MAINNQTVMQVETLVSNTATTENSFQTGADHIIAQVDRSVNRVTITGAVVGSAALADNTTDNQLVVNVERSTGLAPAEVTELNRLLAIPPDQRTPEEQAMIDILQGRQNVDNQVQQNEIAESAKTRFRILRADGTVRFEGDLLVPVNPS